MANYHPPYKTLFFVCYSTIAAIVATEAGLLDNSDSYTAYQSHYAFSDDYDIYLENNKVHPWCGFGLEDEWEVGYLIPNGDHGVRLIGKREYEKLNKRPEDS